MSIASISDGDLIRQRSFVLFWLARLTSTMGYQMLALTIGWQIYEITNSAFDLGLVGLIQFVPAVILTLLIGHAADRYDRRLIVRAAHSVYALAAVMIAAALLAGALNRDLLFAAVFIIGCARAFEMPTAHALAPTLVPPALIPRAVAAWTSANQTAVICGPALGGLVYALSPVLVGVMCLGFFACSITLVTLVQSREPLPARDPPTFASVLAGFHYIRSRRRLLGVITLDLFVVILGGATALLPIYARDILQVGAEGFGLLRSSFTVGALLGALTLTQRPIRRHAGIKLLGTVFVFGAASIVFGISTSFWLSMTALFVMGAADSISVFVRINLVQIITPDEMRGRVGAVNGVFIGASNELGEFESGVTAHWWGTVPAVIVGGAATCGVALLFAAIFRQLRQVDSLEADDLIRRYRGPPAAA